MLLYGARIWGFSIYVIVLFLALFLLFVNANIKKYVSLFVFSLIFNLLLDPSFERLKYSALFIVFIIFVIFGHRIKQKQILSLIIFEVFLYWYNFFIGSIGFLEFPEPLTVIGVDLVGLQFGNPNNLGFFFFLAFCINIHNRTGWLISTVLLLSLFLVGSRGLLILSLMLFLFAYKKSILKNTFLLSFVGFLLSIFILNSIELENYTYLLSKYSQITEYSVTSVKRLDYLNEWSTLTWLPFGKSFSESMVTAPHNFFIELSFLLGFWPIAIFLILKLKIPLDWRIPAVFLGGLIPSTVIAFPIYGLLIGNLLSYENFNYRRGRIFRITPL